jgi:hypothetical protein
MPPRERQKLQPRDTQRPNIGYDRAGPSQLERLLSNPKWNQGDDNTGLGIDPDILRNLRQAPGVIDHTIRDMQIPGEGVIKPENPQLPPWHPGNISDDSYWNVKYELPGQNSGVMAAMTNNPIVMQAKNLYEKIDPWIPNMDFGDEEIGYEWEKPLLGGTLGYGFDYDWDDEDVGAFINWKLGIGS